MLNCFILFHKCGNNYVTNVHAVDKGADYVPDVTPRHAVNISEHDIVGRPVNVRCRNFSAAVVEHSGLLNDDDARLAIFTRDPASFVHSASKYHLRGSESWAVNDPQPLLGGVPLTTALRSAASTAEQQIIIMRQFDWLYQAMTSFLPFLNDPRLRRVRCEEIFVTKDEAYFYDLAKFLRLAERKEFVRALMVSSPAFVESLPRHSTGSFQIEDPYDALEDEAREYFDLNWAKYREQLA